jgi:hypothetical protein
LVLTAAAAAAGLVLLDASDMAKQGLQFRYRRKQTPLPVQTTDRGEEKAAAAALPVAAVEAD